MRKRKILDSSLYPVVHFTPSYPNHHRRKLKIASTSKCRLHVAVVKVNEKSSNSCQMLSIILKRRGHEGTPTSKARGHAKNLGTWARGHANIKGTKARRARHLTDSREPLFLLQSSSKSSQVSPPGHPGGQ